MSFPGSSDDKESTCNAGDLGSIPGLGRSPGEGNGNPLEYSGLENSMDCIVYGVTKSRTRLSDFHFHWYALNCKVFTFYSHSYFCSQDCSPGYLVCGLQFLFFRLLTTLAKLFNTACQYIYSHLGILLF